MTSYETETSKMLWEQAMQRNKVIYDNGVPVCAIPERIYTQENILDKDKRENLEKKIQHE